MRVAIYQRWLATLGGGERYTLELAQALRDWGHTVTLLTHHPIEPAAIIARLGLDIDGITIHALPFDPLGAHICQASGDYDWFINATHGMLIRGQAAFNTLLAWFPLPLDEYDFGGSITPDHLNPTVIEHVCGVYAVEAHAPWVWRWTGPQLDVLLRRRWPSAATTLRLECAPIWSAEAPAPLIRAFANDQQIGTQTDWWRTWKLRLPQANQREWRIRLEITSSAPTLTSNGDSRHLGIPLVGIALQGRWGPQWFISAIGKPLHPSTASRAQAQATLDTYQAIWTISAFSEAWISRRWERESQIVYPAVAAITPREKHHRILSVGRFFTGAHNKKHGPLIEAFRALCDAGLNGWEYHLVGGCDDGQPEQQAYLEALQERANGYPIIFHVNASLAELHAAYGHASIFWHAAGFEEDAEATPERMEHFGIVTVEAMSAGCVPVVIDQAGQSEIVEHEISGLRWNTLTELQQHTQTLIAQPTFRQTLARAAQTRAAHFNAERFRERLAALIPHDTRKRAE